MVTPARAASCGRVVAKRPAAQPFGVTLTEIADLELSAQDCAEDGKYDVRYVAAPVKGRQRQRLAIKPIAIKERSARERL